MSRLYVSGTGIVLFLIPAGVYLLTKEKDPAYAALLLFLPVAQFPSFHVLKEQSSLRTLSLIIVTFSSLLHSVSWIAYSLLVGIDSRRYLSITPHPRVAAFTDRLYKFDFFWTSILLMFALYLTVLILSREDTELFKEWLSRLPSKISTWLSPKINKWNLGVRRSIKDHPIFSTFLIFSIFLHVTYSLGFSLALHDKREGGFYVSPVPLTREVGILRLASEDGEIPDNTNLYRNLHEAIKSRNHAATSAIRIVVEGAVTAKDSGKGEGLRRTYSTGGVEDAIKDLGSKLGLDGNSRVEWVFKTMSEREGEVVSIPSSTIEGGGDINPELSVTTIVYKNPHDAELIDYINFIVYTMVTTGYGDLIPVSAFSKMTCAFANIFELFFTMIFFAVFLSFVGPWGEK